MEMLKKNSEFKRVYNNKNSIANRNLVMYIAPNDLEYSRLGVSVSKKVGKAYVRNKIKRRLKEIFRLGEGKIKKGYDIIFIARISAASTDFKELKGSVFHLLRKKNMQI